MLNDTEIAFVNRTANDMQRVVRALRPALQQLGGSVLIAPAFGLYILEHKQCVIDADTLDDLLLVLQEQLRLQMENDGNGGCPDDLNRH